MSPPPPHAPPPSPHARTMLLHAAHTGPRLGGSQHSHTISQHSHSPAAAMQRGATRTARRGVVPARASQSGSTTAAAPAAVDMQERMAFLQADLMHLFDDQGVDASQYDDVVTFLDPITKYDSVQGYMFNIRMLKTMFSPVFELHDIRQTGPLEATTRWTMTMKFTPAKALGLSKLWDPTITFTGTSVYGFNPANGRINRHVDTWDSITNQAFFSFEAFGDFWRQLLATHTMPALGSPEYTLLRRTATYQVRRYKPFLVAQTQLDNLEILPSSSGSGSGSSGSEQRQQQSVSPATAGMRAFNALAKYIFGGNSAGSKMAMTTPVFTSTDGTMQFVVDAPAAAGQQASPGDLPAPLDPAVQLRQQPGGVYAAAVFSGVATPRACADVAARLLADLKTSGLRAADASAWTLARYNDPSVKPRFRRNEVLVALKDFDVCGGDGGNKQ